MLLVYLPLIKLDLWFSSQSVKIVMNLVSWVSGLANSLQNRLRGFDSRRDLKSNP